MISQRRCDNCRLTGHDTRNCPTLIEHRADERSMNRLCYICNETGHDPSRCQHSGDNNQEHSVFCFLCEENGHILFDCPFHKCILEKNMEDVVNMDLQRHLNKTRINWDKCGKCGADNTGSICSCGEKQVTTVPCNEKGIFECTICYTDLRELNKVTTKCGHHFCVDCFLAHYTSNHASSSDCPMCRAGLIESKEQPVTPADNEVLMLFQSDPHFQLVMNNLEIVREFNAEIF